MQSCMNSLLSLVQTINVELPLLLIIVMICTYTKLWRLAAENYIQKINEITTKTPQAQRTLRYAKHLEKTAPYWCIIFLLLIYFLNLLTSSLKIILHNCLT